MKHKSLLVLASVALAACSGTADLGAPVEQVVIERVNLMPDMPESYQMID